MKALVHCTLLALLFVPTVIKANSSSPAVSSVTTQSNDGSATTVSSVTTQSNDESATTVSSVTTQSNDGSATTVSSVTTQSNDGSATTVSSVTTQSNDGSSSITVTESDSQETVSSVTLSSVISSNTRNPNPDNTTGHCKEDSCSGGASCVGLKVSHFCLCANGYYYNSSQCNRGKIFPGTITVTVSETSGLQDGHSAAYEQLHLEVTEFFKNAFAETDYGQTVINNVRISPSASSEFRANQDVVITVVNLFLETTKENKTSVSRAIDEAIKNSSVITKYAAQDLCDFYGCVKTEGEEDCNDGLLCKCKDGLERPNPQIALCVRTTEATSCPDGCNAEHHKQCLMRDGLTPECLCLPGYKQKDGGICQACAFGYGGVDCEDYFQLILIIVGIVAGLLILGMMIALILVRSKGKKNNIEEENLIKNDFQNLRLQETSGFSNLGAEGSIFPKIRTSYSRENQLQNPYVNQRGIPRPDY